MRAAHSLHGKSQPWSPLTLLPGEHHRTIFLLVFSTAIYLPILFNGLVWDADLLIRHDPRLRDLRHAFDYFYQGLWGFDTNRAVDYYRPIIGLLHNLEYSLFGTNPLAYNLINLLLNAGVCLLAYKLLTRFLSPDNAFWGATIYASLPIRTEVVYWTYSDSHLMVAIFILLSIITYIDRKPIASFLFFILALLTQEVAVVVPAIIFVVALHKKNVKNDIFFILSCFIGSLSYLVARTMVLGPGFLKKAATVNDPQLILYLFAKYLKILFIQDAAISIYAQDPHKLQNFMLITIFGILLLAGMAAMAVFSFQKNHQNLIWIAWFILLMLPTFLIGKLGTYYMAEKPLFLSSLGIIVLLINSIRTSNRYIVAIIIVVVLTNSYLTYAEGKYWKSTETFLEKTLEFDDTFLLGLAALGDACYARGDYEPALKYYQKIITLNPWHLGAINSIRQIEKIKRGQAPLQPAQ